MIVDDAEVEIELATDPFIEAGIEVPPNLPYQENKKTEESYKKVLGEDEEETSMTNRIRKFSRKMSGWAKVGKRVDNASLSSFKRKNRAYSIHQDLIPQQGIVKRKQCVR